MQTKSVMMSCVIKQGADGRRVLMCRGTAAECDDTADALLDLCDAGTTVWSRPILKLVPADRPFEAGVARVATS